ncbi:polysaccharide deacetylase family protein [Thalassospira sp. TSL5-1]|uniref:polysaccharide deacetylase family protein n=1 Tax=Thalassospira sp. TSL5-1 TaxID=1544451 RepID=UPI00093EE667|nr:polysaccharide deacetylase family protein [Thalassospira sp. TSL5-1]OKH89740.1 hypothetical protein LF95_07455 [Thalassospira sp. TSL5-1]
MGTWDDLRTELDCWAQAGQQATMWWRDDDAVSVTPQLEEILSCERSYHVPLALAVVPGTLENDLPERLVETVDTRILQHGWRHQSHTPADRKKQELDDVRPVESVLAEVQSGFDILTTRFASRFLPVMVPPWNRIAPAVLQGLPKIGIRAVSTFGARKASQPIDGLLQVNTHIDVIDWRGTRGFVGESPCLAAMIDHLQGRRTGTYDPEETTGLLTHHLVHDAPTTTFLHDLFSFEHPALQWQAIPGVFPWQ